MTTKTRQSFYRNLFFSAYLMLIGSGFCGLWLYRHPPIPATSADETLKPLEPENGKFSQPLAEDSQQETAPSGADHVTESVNQSGPNELLGHYLLPGIFVRERASDENTETTAFISE